MTTKDLAEYLGIALAIASLIGLIAAAIRYVLNSFHSEHIAPAFADVAHSIKENTSATANLTNALAVTNQTQRDGQKETRQTFERMGGIIQDHETRITVIESKDGTPKRQPRRKPQ